MKQRRKEEIQEVEWIECTICNGTGIRKSPTGLTEHRCSMCGGKKRVVVRAKKRGGK